MPRRKAQGAADLSALSKPAETMAAEIGVKKQLEYATELTKWQAEGLRLQQIAKAEVESYQTNIDRIMKTEDDQGRTLNSNTAAKLREQAAAISKTQTKVALGEMDYQDGYLDIARDSKGLDQLEGSAGNLNALHSKLSTATTLNPDEIGALIYSGDGKTADLATVIGTMYDPMKSGEVKYTTDENGNAFYEMDIPADSNTSAHHAKIPVARINAIMSGEAPEYPVEFNEDPTNEAKAVNDVVPEGVYMTEDERSIATVKGGYKTTVKGKTMYIDREAYIEEVKKQIPTMLKNPQQFRKYFNVIGGKGLYTGDNDPQDKEAIELMAEWMADKFLPQATKYQTHTGVIKTPITSTGNDAPTSTNVNAKTYGNSYVSNQYTAKRFVNSFLGKGGANKFGGTRLTTYLNEQPGNKEDQYVTGEKLISISGKLNLSPEQMNDIKSMHNDWKNVIYTQNDDGVYKKVLSPDANYKMTLNAINEATGITPEIRADLSDYTAHNWSIKKDPYTYSVKELNTLLKESNWRKSDYTSLRDAVNAFYTQYYQNRKKSNPNITFQEAVNEYDEGIGQPTYNFGQEGLPG